MELSASPVQQSRVFVYVGVRLWERSGVPGGSLCPPPFREAVFFRIARERHGLFLDRDLERKRERKRERDGEEGWRGYVVTDRQAIMEYTCVDNKEFSRKWSFMHCMFMLCARICIFEIFTFHVS